MTLPLLVHLQVCHESLSHRGRQDATSTPRRLTLQHVVPWSSQIKCQLGIKLLSQTCVRRRRSENATQLAASQFYMHC